MTHAEQVEQIFLEIYNKLGVGVAPDKRRADIIDSIWGDIYNIVFKPDASTVRFNNCKSKLITYNVQDVADVCNMFIKLNKRYGGVIKYNQFCNLTGISRYTIYLWHAANKSNGYIVNLSNDDISKESSDIYIVNNDGTNNNYIYYNGNGHGSNSSRLSTFRFDVVKKLQEEMQDANTNGLSNDTMGQVVRANNEEELGKLYEPKRMYQQETFRRSLSASELPKLGSGNCAALPDNSIMPANIGASELCENANNSGSLEFTGF